MFINMEGYHQFCGGYDQYSENIQYCGGNPQENLSSTLSIISIVRELFLQTIGYPSQVCWYPFQVLIIFPTLLIVSQHSADYSPHY